MLKISEREYAQDELENYNRFVKWVLPYSWRVELLGSGFTEKHGAICYAFVLSDYEEFDSLTHFLSTGRRAVVEKAVSKIFDPSMRRWYADVLIREENNINQRYMSRYFPGQGMIDDLTNLFSTFCQEVFDKTIVSKSTINVYGKKYPLPVDRLFGQPNGHYQSCICHGDLNSDNVVVARNDEIIFIDFQNTGRGHVFEDFITMEASVRLNYRDDLDTHASSSMEQAIEWEMDIDNDSAYDHLPPAYQIIADIRSKARANFKKEPIKNYYYGVAAFNSRLLRLRDLDSKSKGKILPAILAALRKLDDPG